MIYVGGMILVLLLVGLNLVGSEIPRDYRDGVAAWEANRFDEAKSHFRRFLLAHKDHSLYPDGLYYYGRLETDGEDAKKIFHYLFTHYPENQWAPHACLMLAKYHYSQGDLEVAAGWLRRLDSHYPESGIADASDRWFERLNCTKEEKKWAIQVGAFRDHDNAKRVAEKLKDLEYPVVLIRREGHEVILWLVRVGYYFDHDRAIAAQGGLEEAGYRTYLVEKQCRN